MLAIWDGKCEILQWQHAAFSARYRDIKKTGAKHRPQAGAAGTENNAIGERKVLDSIIKCENIRM